MNLEGNQPYYVSLHYDETMWHKAIIQGIKPFIENEKDINTFLFKLNRERGDSIRMAVLLNKNTNAKVFAEYIDDWFKNFLLKYPSTLSKSLIIEKALFLNFKNNKTIYSGWWVQKDPKKSRKLLSNFIKVVERFHLENSNTFIINYEDIIIKNSNLKKLFSFLEIPYNPKKIDETLQTNHSFSPRSKLQKDKRITYTHPFFFKKSIKYFTIDFFELDNDILNIGGILILENDELTDKHELYFEKKSNDQQKIPPKYSKVLNKEETRFELKNISIGENTPTNCLKVISKHC
ncbi:hypothetical protein [Algibacter pacificus]|uniref:hypothetical protein n=1 Tax=Algibacter pacificus TaxID=2599389 RepID=UPI0011C8F96C|nr:hypothetical protein [Algibacter pacificus]